MELAKIKTLKSPDISWGDSAIFKSLNGFLSHFNLHVIRDSRFRGMLHELARRQQRVDELSEALKQKEDFRDKDLFVRSQSRWRADEPDAGLTWGVPMVGDAFVQFLCKNVPMNEDSTVVEVGPGYGRILDALLKHRVPFRRYIGLEISTARVDRLREKFQDWRIEFREADVLAGINLQAAADVTFSSAVFEHLYPDFDAAVRTISAFTRPGGAVVIDFVRLDDALETSTHWFEDETYIRVYSLGELRTLFSESGFTLRECDKISFGEDINKREIVRTIIRATKGDCTGPSLRAVASTPAPSVDLATFDALVNRHPAYDPDALEAPVKPAFRHTFGGFWTDLNTADVILAGKVAIGELSSAEGDLVETWIRDGFVILRGAVNPAAIDAVLIDFERAYDGALPRKMSFWDERGFHIEDAGKKYAHKKEAKLLDLHTASEAVQAAIFAQAISRFLHILFERPALAFQSLGFYHGSQQGLHQDSAYVRVSSPLELVASWIALEDIRPGSGELEYYPGSHAIPHLLFGGKRLWGNDSDPENVRFPDMLTAKAEEAGLSKQRFAARKGDVLIWSAGLMHGGSAVEDPQLTRKSLVTHYCPADLQPMYAYRPGRFKRRLPSGHYVMDDKFEEAPSTYQEI